MRVQRGHGICHAMRTGRVRRCGVRGGYLPEKMKRSDEGKCADFYHLGFRRNSGSGRGARCRCRRCDRGIVGPAPRRRPVFRRRLRERWVIVGRRGGGTHRSPSLGG